MKILLKTFLTIILSINFAYSACDLIAEFGGSAICIQCKRYSQPVGNKAVQEAVAGMKYYEATEGVVIAPNGFTNSAKNLAKANNIKLIHHNEINSL